MTLLTIAEDVTDDIGIGRPTSIVGNGTADAQKLLRIINAIGDRIMKTGRTSFQVITKEQTFTSVATEEQVSILPSDFDRFTPETFWNRTDSILYTGPVTPTEWQSLKAHSFSNDQSPRFRHRDDSVLIIPTPEAGKSLAFEYISKNWAQTAASVAKAKFTLDDDTAIISEELITKGAVFQYRVNESLPSASALADFMDYWNELLNNDQPDAGVLTAGDIFTSGSRRFTGEPSASGSENLF